MRQSVTPREVAAAEWRLPEHLHGDLVTGRVRQPQTDAPAVFYTDGSVSRRQIGGRLGWITGWGYIAVDGRYGCGKYPQFTGKTGNDVVVTTELRGVWHAVGEVLADGPVTVIIDSTHAADVLRKWQAGDTTMPGGYTGSRRRVPTLELLRQAIAAHPGHLTVQHVKGHAGNVLNEAADTLAQLGMRWARDNLTSDDVVHRAEGVAGGFLDDYRRHR